MNPASGQWPSFQIGVLLLHSAIVGRVADWFGAALIGSLVAALLVLADRAIRHNSDRRLFRAITGFDPATPPLVIIGAPLRAQPGATVLTEQAEGLPLFGFGPLAAFALMSSRLLKVSPSQRANLPEVIVSSQFDTLPESMKRERDLFLIGYPAGNEAARSLEPLMNLPVEFAADGARALVDKDGLRVIETEYRSTPHGVTTVRDAGLVAKVRHPLNPNRTILYVAGCETFGVKIAMEALSPPLVGHVLGLGLIGRLTWRHKWLPKLGLSTAERSEFVAIASADVQHLSTGVPHLVVAWVRGKSNDGAEWHQAGEGK